MVNLRTAENKQDIKNIHNLYKKAFPKCERKPFKFLLELAKIGKSTHYVIEDENNNFLGLMLTLNNEDLVLLDFLAIVPKFRNQKIGSKALNLFMNIYSKKRIVLEIEDTAITNAKNIQQRINRKNFYLKNNMTLANYKVNLFGCKMEILTNNTNVSFKEYKAILTSVMHNKAEKNVTQL